MDHMAVRPEDRTPRPFSAEFAFKRILLGTLLTVLYGTAAPAADAPWKSLKQGIFWTAEARANFYSRDQGSRLIPLHWITALKQPDGSPFMAASLARYGYLPNEGSTPPGLPVGFTVANTTSGETLGITCAACHTRQITAKGTSYRVDGGPAIVDFQSFLSDLDAAVGRVLDTDSQFVDFSLAILGPAATAADKDALHQSLQDWYLPFHTIVTRGLPPTPWGPGRLDAVSMIFNRLSGLDIGASADHIISSNIYPADAPVRYPFLWNAPRQDQTQWLGFADNGNAILALGRNVGEVTGVFAAFHPKKDAGRLFGINLTGENSTNFEGLDELERLVKKIEPPHWPWPVNKALATEGRKIFAQNCSANCHEVKRGKIRSLNLLEETWATPVLNVRSDTREWSILYRTVDPGVLEGAYILGVQAPLQNPDSPLAVLNLAVVGSIIQHTLPIVVPSDLGAQMEAAGTALSPATQALAGAFRYGAAAPQFGSYEARVLRGIWAAAPYLHNGSVPTLAELLKPASDRVGAFNVGPAYDLDTVGLAMDQTAFSQVRQTTDCSDLNSGNSRCGHEFGTSLPPSQKKALLEYLKTL
jgi:hypothetical protein